MKVILDTNTVMAIGQMKLDLFEELERLPFEHNVFVLDKTIDELEKIKKKSKGKDSQAAKLALSILKAKGIKKIKSSPGYVDDLLVKLSKAGAIVVTQDKELKSRLTKPYLTIRQKKTVVKVE
ncbi:MAG: DNA-binding protein [Nanoarchaeota archaeon]|jgi:hypothetical protein|nr:DNA-binding protein [Nanoarchaeota archaeon]|tara:strand:+ start:234 stop:602 length:369 start_codon:yes stop_codon:yes gene_type:complete